MHRSLGKRKDTHYAGNSSTLRHVDSTSTLHSKDLSMGQGEVGLVVVIVRPNCHHPEFLWRSQSGVYMYYSILKPRRGAGWPLGARESRLSA